MAGRPRKKIDKAQVKKLASYNLSVAEIGAVLGCSADTLQRRYAAPMAEGRLLGNFSLKRKQMEMALAGNPTMLVWLGKQNLGQSDKREMTGKDGGPLLTVSVVDQIIADANTGEDD